MKRPSIITATFVIVAFTAAPAKAQTYQEQGSGAGPTDRFFQLLGIVAQVAPTFMEVKGNQRIARIQAGAAKEAARIEGRYNYRGVRTQSKAQIRVADIGASAQRYVANVETRGNVRIAHVNAGATRYAANTGARADILSSLFGYQVQVYSANRQSRDAELERNLRKIDSDRSYELQRREQQSTYSFRQAASRAQAEYRGKQVTKRSKR